MMSVSRLRNQALGPARRMRSSREMLLGLPTLVKEAQSTFKEWRRLKKVDQVAF